LRDILHVRAVERPEARDRMSPRDRGTLIHDVLEQFLRQHPRDDPEHAWSADERAALRSFATEQCENAERDGLTGRSVLWAIDRTRILRELERVLDADEVVRAERGLVPHGFEVGFGHDDDDLPPVQIELGSGVPVRFRGRIDRVDRATDGHIEVFDYKTGHLDLKPDALAEDPVIAGRRLQLAIYGLAVRQGDPSQAVRASYWFTRESVDDALLGFELDATTDERVHDVLDLMADEISSGHFPAYPGPDNYFRGPDNCRYCDYTRLCPPDRVRRFERRRDEPEFAGIRWLAEGPDDDAIDEDAAAEAGES
jgi:RecB family exonuclease